MPHILHQDNWDYPFPHIHLEFHTVPLYVLQILLALLQSLVESLFELQLLRIEEDLGEVASYPGRSAFYNLK